MGRIALGVESIGLVRMIGSLMCVRWLLWQFGDAVVVASWSALRTGGVSERHVVSRVWWNESMRKGQCRDAVIRVMILPSKCRSALQVVETNL